MNMDAARVLVAVLNAAYPYPTMPEATHALYVSELARLVDEEAARETVETLIRGSHWLPTIAELRETYMQKAQRRTEQREALARERAAEIAEARGLPRPEREPLPESVREWAAANGIQFDQILNDIDPERAA